MEPSQTGLLFVRFCEVNDHEGETWTWWLQLDGNKAQFDKLAVLLRNAADNGDDMDDLAYVLHLDSVEPEAVVDKLVEYAESGYYAAHNKVAGVFTCPDDPGGHCDKLYKGGIRDLFVVDGGAA